MVGSGPSIRVLPKAAQPPRPVQPRPAQVGGASSDGAALSVHLEHLKWIPGLHTGNS